MAIDRLPGISSTTPVSTVDPSTSGAAPVGAADFGQALKDVMGSVDTASGDANAAIGRMIDGSGDVHEAMIAMQKADMMLQLTVQIRNKLIQAYQDIMRMPV
jgi:flagellar hook-basal body complex protein FliE